MRSHSTYGPMVVTPARREARRAPRVLAEGAGLGIASAAVAALWFLVPDLLAGAPFRTPALLGRALFGDAVGSDGVALVLAYTVFHVAVHVLFGLAAAGLFAIAERQPSFVWAIFMLGCCLAVVYVAFAYLMWRWLAGAMAPWIVIVGTALGGLTMLGILLARHRRVLEEAATAVDE
jgi:hypothetical protein